VFCDWNFNLFQNIIDHCSIPQQLLLIQTVDEKRFMQFDVFPCHQIWKSIGVKTYHRVYFRPQLYGERTTDQWCSKQDHISIISISLQTKRERIYLIGLDSTFFCMAQTPRVILPFLIGAACLFCYYFGYLACLSVWLPDSFSRLDDFTLFYMLYKYDTRKIYIISGGLQIDIIDKKLFLFLCLEFHEHVIVFLALENEL